MGGFGVSAGTEIQTLAENIEQLVVEEELEVVTTNEVLRAEGKQPLGTTKIERGGRTMRPEVAHPAGTVGNDLLGSEHENLGTDEANVTKMSLVVNVVGTEILNGA